LSSYRTRLNYQYRPACAIQAQRQHTALPSSKVAPASHALLVGAWTGVFLLELRRAEMRRRQRRRCRSPEDRRMVAAATVGQHQATEICCGCDRS
jgi:hypothetical protein